MEEQHNLRVAQASAEARAFFDERVGVMVERTRLIIKDGAEHVPILFIFPRSDVIPKQDGREKVLAIPVTHLTNGEFGDPKSKNFVAHAQRKIAEANSVRAVFFVVETWVLHGTREEVHGDFKDGISKHPERKEAIMFNMIYHHDDNTIQQLLRMFPIKRPDNILEEPNMTIDPHGSANSDGVSIMTGRFVVENEA